MEQGRYVRSISNKFCAKLVHIEKISGEQTVYFYILYHSDAKQNVEQLERDFRFEPISLPEVSQSPKSVIEEYDRKIEAFEEERDRLRREAFEIAKKRRWHSIDPWRGYYSIDGLNHQYAVAVDGWVTGYPEAIRAVAGSTCSWSTASAMTAPWHPVTTSQPICVSATW